jgi:hypothetical protein
MRNLKELNVLECSSLQRMPSGLRLLTKIEALPRYIATEKNSKAVLKLQGLENMRTLGVDNVDRISKKDAEKMQLQRMHKLEHLAPRCNTDGKCTSTSREVVEDIFDHLNSRALEILRPWIRCKKRTAVTIRITGLKLTQILQF